MRLEFPGVATAVYIVEVSTNLVDWTPVGPATESTPGNYEFQEPDMGRFPVLDYRVVKPWAAPNR